MKLSLAIALGRVLITKTNPQTFCGCALAMGLMGVGKEPCPPNLEDAFTSDDATIDSEIWRQAQEREWPWIEKLYPIPEEFVELCNLCANEDATPAIDIISGLFFSVYDGHITLDELLDWIRSVEPQEPSSVGLTPEEVRRNERAREQSFDLSANTR